MTDNCKCKCVFILTEFVKFVPMKPAAGYDKFWSQSLSRCSTTVCSAACITIFNKNYK